MRSAHFRYISLFFFAYDSFFKSDILLIRTSLISNGMKNKFYILIVLLMAVTGIFLRLKQTRLPVAEVVIGGTWVKADLAATPSSREAGLSGRKSLKEGTGMLFVFSERAPHAFWMKGMLFPIDIIWIDGKTIVDIASSVPPPATGQDPAVLRPRAEANFVLEVPAGLAAASGWKIGDGAVIRYK